MNTTRGFTCFYIKVQNNRKWVTPLQEDKYCLYNCPCLYAGHGYCATPWSSDSDLKLPDMCAMVRKHYREETKKKKNT